MHFLGMDLLTADTAKKMALGVVVASAACAIGRRMCGHGGCCPLLCCRTTKASTCAPGCCTKSGCRCFETGICTCGDKCTCAGCDAGVLKGGGAKYVLKYYPIRGLGAVVRSALTLAKFPFVDDRTTKWWEGEQKELSAKNALLNLPTLSKEGNDGTWLSQTWTILNHLQRVSPVLRPETTTDADRINEVANTLAELQVEKYKATYDGQAGGEGKAKENKDSFFKESVSHYFGAFEKYMARNNTKFLASNKISVADLFFAELVEGCVKLAGHDAWLKDFPKCTAVWQGVVNHADLKAYFAAEKDVPFNSPTYACWV